MLRKYLLTLLLISSLFSCVILKEKPQEMIVQKPSAIEIPMVSEFVDPSVSTAIREKLDIIPEPQTVSDIAHNYQSFRSAYIAWRQYAMALEKYIESVSNTVNQYNMETQNE